MQTVFASAIETIIIGDITNEATGEPIPNVNIHFRGTKIGTTSDPSGAYILRVDLHKKMQLVFSAVGYHSQRFDIEPGSMAGLHVTMREKAPLLSELIVTPGLNPALPLLQRVRANRSINDRTLSSNTSTVQREQKLYISHIQQRHLRRTIWKSLQAGMIMQSDSSYVMPLYQETQSFMLKANQMIPANDQQSKAIIVSSTDYSALLGTEGNLNFYQTTIPLMGHGFLSPLAASGELFYKYFLADSIYVSYPHKTEKHYIIHFRTRNPFYPTLNGELTIDSASYALRSIRAHAPTENTVNYLNQLHISQTLSSTNTIESEHISALLDFAVKIDKAGTVLPTLLLTTHLTTKDTSHIAHTATPYTLHNTQQTDSSFATLDSLPLIRTAKWIATIATTGYIPTKTKVDIGHVAEIIQVNEHEGVHIGFPLRTNASFSDKIALEGNIGYGFKDKRLKGMARISLDLPTPRKHQIHMEYRDGYVWSEVDDFDRMLRENSMGKGDMDFTSYAFEALHRDSLYINTAIRQQQLQFYWFADWTPNVETHTYIRAGWHHGLPHLSTQPIVHHPYAYQSFSFITRFSWQERKHDSFFMRRYTYSSRYPVLWVGLEAGHWAYTTPHANSNLYAHLRLMLMQHASLGIGGKLNYALQAGALFGNAPDAFLWHADANQGYAYDPYRFTFLHGTDIIADKYIALHTEWNGQGVVFNAIPGLRWLHLHELIEAKIAYGHKLYAEIGVGIGNILRVCDLYSIWSLSPHIQWGMRFRIHLGL